ncbi:MAG TPA: lysophospholipid acyltransferase family protein [Alphaproteobacteria bacterium]|nr:lysophospholipid acyltransferase family protein [Alphaproteobacteria bacterium]
MTILRSLLFNLCFYALTLADCFLLMPLLVLPRGAFTHGIRVLWLRPIYWLERLILGLDYRVVGLENLPKDRPYILAAKHQSAWETLKMHFLIDQPAFVLKHELLYLPIWGWFAMKADLIPVKRGRKGLAIASMLVGARRVVGQGRPIVIYPQGTRVMPGQWLDYRVGISILYDELKLPVVPMALNSGVFWPRRSFRKRSGTITIEILPPIEPGLDRAALMARLADSIETASNRLAVEAGGPATIRPAEASAAAARAG